MTAGPDVPGVDRLPGVGRLPEAIPEDRRIGRIVDLAVLLALVALAAVLRFADLATRGTFDSDQGVDALTVRGLVRDGVVPLLGPHTSIGDFHHGALYYYLLAPAGWPSGGDNPVHLVALIAALGVASVAVTWWLGRAIAGPVGGLVAGLVLALSATAVEGSTFIWNPNPIPFFAACSLAAAWRAATGGNAAWWLVAAAAQAMVQQLHVLGVLGCIPLVALWAHTVARSPRDRPALVRAGLAGVVIIALGYLPLLAYELGHGFAETRGAIAWLTSGDATSGAGLAVRLLFVPLRIVSWPLSGPIAAATAVAVVAVAAWVGLVALALLRARGSERRALAWLAGSTGLAIAALALGRPLAVRRHAAAGRSLPRVPVAGDRRRRRRGRRRAVAPRAALPARGRARGTRGGRGDDRGLRRVEPRNPASRDRGGRRVARGRERRPPRRRRGGRKTRRRSSVSRPTRAPGPWTTR